MTAEKTKGLCLKIALAFVALSIFSFGSIFLPWPRNTGPGNEDPTTMILVAASLYSLEISFIPLGISATLHARHSSSHTRTLWRVVAALICGLAGAAVLLTTFGLLLVKAWILVSAGSAGALSLIYSRTQLKRNVEEERSRLMEGR